MILFLNNLLWVGRNTIIGFRKIILGVYLKEIFDVVDLSREGEGRKVGFHGFSVVGVESLRELLHQMVYFVHRVHHSIQHL